VTDREINELWWNAIGYALVAGLALIALLGLYIFVPAVRRRWLPLPRLRPGTWTGHDVFLAFCVFVGFPGVIVMVLTEAGTFTPLIGPAPDSDAPAKVHAVYTLRAQTISSPLSLAVTLGILFAILFARSGCRPHHLGLSWARWQANLGLGLLAFIVSTPIVLTIYFAASLLVQLAIPTRAHPLAELGKDSVFDWEWFFIAFHVTVAAPVLEETVFRGVLQGWLRRASLAGHVGVVTVTLMVAAKDTWYHTPEKDLQVFDLSPFVFAAILAGAYIIWLVCLARKFGLIENAIRAWKPQPESAPTGPATAYWSQEDARQRADERLRTWRNANASLATYGSAMLFASSHSFAWPYPVPLFFLGLALGVLARSTQSLIGPITLHATFNLVAFIGLFGSTHYDIVTKGNAETTAARPSLLGSMTTSVPASQLPRRK
jgi:membrane protease YdiL (CAAX protease family)